MTSALTPQAYIPGVRGRAGGSHRIPRHAPQAGDVAFRPVADDGSTEADNSSRPLRTVLPFSRHVSDLRSEAAW